MELRGKTKLRKQVRLDYSETRSASRTSTHNTVRLHICPYPMFFFFVKCGFSKITSHQLERNDLWWRVKSWKMRGCLLLLAIFSFDFDTIPKYVSDCNRKLRIWSIESADELFEAQTPLFRISQSLSLTTTRLCFPVHKTVFVGRREEAD